MKRREFMRSVAAAGIAGLEFGAGMKTEARGAVSPASELPRRPLGRTGVEVTILALGGVIGMQLAPTKDLDPAVLAETALDSGITYFDTAPSYNNGQSETNYGRVVARRRREVFLTTKTQDRTYDGAMKSVEESLKRLQTDHVDLLQIHGMTPQDDPTAWGKPDGVLTAFRKLRDEKVTRFIGITGHEDAEVLLRAIGMYEFDTLLTTLNPVSRRLPFREKLLPAANAKSMGVIAMKVMGGGNGCLVSGNPFKTLIQPFHDQTSNQVKAEDLVRYTLGLTVTTAVIGVASIEQLRDNIRAAREIPPMAAAERKDLEGRVG
ncbi:MAG: aldo/keto reductase [Candidatus Aminicenantales bacterium]